MEYPAIEINLDVIRGNAAALTALCGKRGIAVAGVVKCTCGSPAVASAMLAGGVKQIADSRLENLERLRNNGINSELLLLPVIVLSDSNLSLDLPLRVWLGIIYLGICANGIAYMCWFSALKYLKAGELGAFGYVSAAMTMVLSLVLLQEKISFLFLAALALVFYGVYLMMKVPSSQKDKPQ